MMENTLSKLQGDSFKQPPQKPPAVKETLVMKAKKSIENMGIKTKVTLLAIAFSVIPVLAVGIVAYVVSGESIVKQVKQDKVLESKEISAQVNRFLVQQETTLQTLASVIVNIMVEHKTLSVKERNEEVEDVLTLYARNNYSYSHLGIYNVQGKEIVEARGTIKQGDQGNFLYFQQAVNSGLSTISEPIVTQAGGYDQYTIYIATPLKGPTGILEGVLVTAIPTQFIGDAAISRVGARSGTVYRLVDAGGAVFQILGDTEGNLLSTQADVKFPEFSDINKTRETTIVLGETDIYVYTPFNYSLKRRQSYLQWSVLTSTSNNIAFAAQRKLLQTIGVGTVFAAGVAGFLATIMANRSLQPVLKASSAVQKLGQGQLDTRLEVRGNDELAQLGGNINQMAEQLEQLLERQRISTERLIYQNSILNDLAQYEALVQGDVKASAVAFTEATSSTLKVEMASIWLLNTTRDELTCVDWYNDKTNKHTDGMNLRAEDHPVYFRTLEEFLPIAVDNLEGDNPKKEFMENHLIPMGITSTLDIPIRTADRIVGVVICEHTGEPRSWEASEISFGTSVGNLVALALESQLIQEEVGDLLESVSAVEDGDLTIRAHVSERSTGLVADTLNRLLEQLSQILLQVRSVANKVSERSTELERLANQVADNATTQADEAGGVLQLTQEVAMSAQGSTQKVEEANESLKEVRSYVEQGQNSMEEMNQSVVILQQGTERMVQQTKALAEFVGLADQFVQDQTQIASLTQVLALNATLVAARASEQKDPRKFSEVAREFETIAQQVSTLAQQTNDGLGTLQQRTDQINNVVMAINGEVQGLANLVDEFNQGVQESNQVFRQVQIATQGVVQVGQTVAESSQAILTAAQSTAQGMYDIAELAQATAELTKESLSQSEEMESLSANLLSRISFFRLPDSKATQP